MKKLMFAAAVMAAGAAMAIESQIVGYTTRTIPAKTWALVANNFQTTSGESVSIQDLIPTEGLVAGTASAAASQIQIAKASGSGFDVYYYCSEAWNESSEDWDLTAWVKEGGDEPATVKINPGQGFWFQNPTAIDLTTSGQVVSELSYKKSLAAKTWALVGNPYPVAFALNGKQVNWELYGTAGTASAAATQIQIAKNGGGFDVYYYCSEAWNESSEDWDLTAWVKEGGDEPVSTTVPVCTGFWIQNPTAVDLYFTR